MNMRRLLMGAAFLVAAWLALFADKTPQAEQMQASETDLAPTMSRTADGTSQKPGPVAASGVTILRLRERAPYVARGHEDDAEHSAEPALFGAFNWDPPPPKVVAGPPPPPQAPPLPYTYIGKKLELGAWEVYLALGEDTRIVRPNSTLDEKYRVDSIVPPTLSLTYLPLKQPQTMNIGTTE